MGGGGGGGGRGLLFFFEGVVEEMNVYYIPTFSITFIFGISFFSKKK